MNVTLLHLVQLVQLEGCTIRHTCRTARIAHRLGGALRLRPAQHRALLIGAVLHDIGKAHVPKKVLNKPGPLSDLEWHLMRAHPEHGEAMARRLVASPEVLDVVRHHHERFDGSGYPDRLAGDAIPYLARVLQVCDVYDALTSHRPYRLAWTKEAALRELSAQGGVHYDPGVVRAFTALQA